MEIEVKKKLGIKYSVFKSMSHAGGKSSIFVVRKRLQLSQKSKSWFPETISGSKEHKARPHPEWDASGSGTQACYHFG